MDGILSFFSDLILATAGIFVCLLWLAIIVVISVEAYDLVTGNKEVPAEEEEYL